MMTTGQFIIAMLGVLGAGKLLELFARQIIRHWTGKARRERSRIDQLESDRVSAERERDHQALWRRLLQEYASQLRSLLIEQHGVHPRDLPPVPPEPKK